LSDIGIGKPLMGDRKETPRLDGLLIQSMLLSSSSQSALQPVVAVRHKKMRASQLTLETVR
jgi:hypothetical protein